MQTGLRTVPLVTSERRAIRLTRAQRLVSMFGAQAPEHGEGHDAPVKLAQAQHMRLPLPLVAYNNLLNGCLSSFFPGSHGREPAHAKALSQTCWVRLRSGPDTQSS